MTSIGEPSRSARRQRLWLIALTLIAYLACIGTKLAVYDFDISRFIVAGDHFVAADQLVSPIAVEKNSDGYDGQFFYRMALDPATRTRVDHGISMQNHPVVRVQRIVYPAAAWTISLGHAAAVPYALVVVNLLALALIGWAAVLLAVQFGVPARLGLLIPFFPGFVLSIVRDMAEIPATALALCSLLAASKGRWPVAASLASAAVLTRESTLLYLVGYGVIALAQSLRNRALGRRIFWCLVPLLVYLAWQSLLKYIWGQYGFEVVGSDDLSSLPLVDYGHAVARAIADLVSLPFRFYALYKLTSLLAIAGFLLFVAHQLLFRRGPGRLPVEMLIPWCLYVAMTMVFTEAVWRDPWGYVRILCDFYVLGVVILIVSRRQTALRALAPFVAGMWLATFVFAI